MNLKDLNLEVSTESTRFYDQRTGEPYETTRFWIRENELSHRALMVNDDDQSKALAALFAHSPKMLAGLEAIARKAPHKVSREEAADLACEFHAIASKLVAQLEKPKAEEAEAG